MATKAWASTGRVLAALHESLARSRSAVLLATKIRNQCSAVIAHRVSSGPQFESNGELWAIEQVAPSSRFFVDVGANVGNWARAFAARMSSEPRGLLVEPSPEAVTALRLAIRTAGLYSLDILQSAASDRVGNSSFFMEASCGETSSFLEEHSLREAKKISVTTITLDNELSERKIDFVDFLKIDAEGHDFNILRGTQGYIEQNQIAAIQFEYNYPWQMVGSTLRSAFQFLEGYGYKVYLLKKGGLFKLRPDTFGEYYAYSNFIAYIPAQSTQALEAAVKYEL